jgi:amphi-Trp domain-containing protein
MTKNQVKARGTVEFQRGAGYLEGILEGMKNGRIVVRQGDQSVTFRHVDALEMEIEAGKGREARAVHGDDMAAGTSTCWRDGWTDCNFRGIRVRGICRTIIS